MGMANIRLGTWWASQDIQPGNSPSVEKTNQQTYSHSCRNTKDDGIFRNMFRTQRYLFYELTGRFFGLDRQLQYLTDGGHFENMGVYELLRKERNVSQIFACDSGADPYYRFGDLSNLIRLARIDFQMEIKIETDFKGALKNLFASPQVFQRLSDSRKSSKDTLFGPSPGALLLWAYRKDETFPSIQIIVIKPNIASDAAVDLQQYALDHPDFPQESTVDQFFNEAQWESYRALGSHLGRKIFNVEVLSALKSLAANKSLVVPDFFV
jgi:hypothetical protein